MTKISLWILWFIAVLLIGLHLDGAIDLMASFRSPMGLAMTLVCATIILVPPLQIYFWLKNWFEDRFSSARKYNREKFGNKYDREDQMKIKTRF